MLKPAQAITSVVFAAIVATSGYAQTHAVGQTVPESPPPSANTSAPFANGEVLDVYAKEKRILLKHGPIANIGMDAMTMEFGLADSKMLLVLKPGDKVRFSAKEKKGEYVVTRIEVQK